MSSSTEILSETGLDAFDSLGVTESDLVKIKQNVNTQYLFTLLIGQTAQNVSHIIYFINYMYTTATFSKDKVNEYTQSGNLITLAEIFF